MRAVISDVAPADYDEANNETSFAVQVVNNVESVSYSSSYNLFFGMLAGAFYSFGYAFEIVSLNMEQIRFWLKVEYIGILFGTLIRMGMTNKEIAVSLKLTEGTIKNHVVNIFGKLQVENRVQAVTVAENFHLLH